MLTRRNFLATVMTAPMIATQSAVPADMALRIWRDKQVYTGWFMPNEIRAKEMAVPTMHVLFTHSERIF